MAMRGLRTLVNVTFLLSKKPLGFQSIEYGSIMMSEMRNCTGAIQIPGSLRLQNA